LSVLQEYCFLLNELLKYQILLLEYNDILGILETWLK
jgi:hypothetical protein